MSVAPSAGLHCDLTPRIRAREAAAFLELYDLTVLFVYRLALRLTSREDFAADITEHVFAQVWRSPEHLDPERGTLLGALGELAHARAVVLCAAVSDDAPVPKRTLERAEDAAATWRQVLQALSVADRHAVELICLGGHTLTGGAAALQRSVTDVASSLQRALRAAAAVSDRSRGSAA